jgi:hypothetical protein
VNFSTSSSEPHRAAARFLRALAGWLVLGAAGVMGWNYVVDPFEMYHTWTFQGFNHAKSGNLGAYDRMAKAKEIALRRPDGLLLGTSRVDLGLEPHHPRLQAISPDFYNAALAGCTLYEALRYLQHAQALRPQRYAIIGLDLEMFLAGDVRDSYREGRLAVRPDGSPNPGFRFADLAQTLFTQDALAASRATLKMSRQYRDIPPAEIARRGNPLVENLDARTRWHLYKVGVREARNLLGNLARQQGRIAEQWPTYESMLAFAHDHDITLTLFITPYHLAFLETIRQGGGWETFEWWKRELVYRNARVAAQRGRAPFPLWDFSGYHDIATEPVPTSKTYQRVMTWYRESSHYRKRTGDIMIDRMAGATYPDVPARWFGVALAPPNLEDVLSAQRRFRDRWVDRWLPETAPEPHLRPSTGGSSD